MRIFLSHSSVDKAFVRKLSQELKARGFDTWVDEEQILLGKSISESIEKGLNSSQVLFLILSDSAVKSGWVSLEWRSQFSSSMSGKNIIIIPIKIDECEIPALLGDYLYADFTDKSRYEDNLNGILSQLNRLKPEVSLIQQAVGQRHDSILHAVYELLDDLSEECLSFPDQPRIFLVKSLKRIPRSGKLLRLQSYRTPGGKGVRARTIFDHIMSNAHVADCILPHLRNGVRDQEVFEIARCIAYHELNEVILGDIPDYTNVSAKGQNRIKIQAEARLRSVASEERELISNKLIWMYLGEKQRRSMETYLKIITATPLHPTFRTFKAFDKIDPIISVWRYLNHYRGQLGPDAQIFIQRLRDFFDNPGVKSFLENINAEPQLVQLVKILQEKRCAREYYINGGAFFKENQSLFSLPAEAVQMAIEGIPLYFERGPD